jgi:hypothetical protein
MCESERRVRECGARRACRASSLHPEDFVAFKSLLAKLGIGAAIMYFFDPKDGDRRRHVAWDKARKALRSGGRELHDAAENAKNHAVGAVAEARSRMNAETPEDARLVDRVRAELGHHVERVRNIEVVADGGCVTLRGTVPADKMDTAVKTVQSVAGVREVDNRLIAEG